MSHHSRSKLVVIGLDGLNFDVIQRLLPKEVLPAIWGQILKSASGELTSVFPTHSASAWVSFMTGQTPARHGIFDFKLRRPDGRYQHAKPALENTIWHFLGSVGYRLGVFNFPMTFPPDPINGWMVSGMLSPDLQRFTYPNALAGELTGVFPEYMLDVEWMLYEGQEQKLLHAMTAMVKQRAMIARYLLEHYPVDVFAMAFIATDRAQHALWRYLDPLHPGYDAKKARALRPAIYHFYTELDRAVASVLEYTGSQSSVLLLSDHGFQAAAWQFHVDGWLQSQGWQRQRSVSGKLKQQISKMEPAKMRHLRRRLWPDLSRHVPAFQPGGSINWSKTLAFCPWNFHQGIRLNVRGREPEGVVSPGREFQQLRAEIGSALAELRWPKDGTRVVAKLYNGENLYPGPDQDCMPDLVFALSPNFAAGIHRPRLFEATGWLSGDHSMDGFYALQASECQPGLSQPAHLVDIAPTILHLLGVPVPDNMDGKPLVAIRRETPTVQQAGDLAVEAQDGLVELSSEDEARLLQQLRDLGYM
ncbi:MAG: alkaline phosphatase family protein [Anaerolineales bacterium]|nr:alkaline phosphatase family protein [Anaerolineales bacterium]